MKTNNTLHIALAGGLGILLALPGSSVAGLFSETFEGYAVVPTNVAAIGNGWNASGTCTVEAAAGLSGGQGMNLGVGAIAWNAVNTNASPNRIWTDWSFNQTNFATSDTLPLVVPSTVFMVSVVSNSPTDGRLYAMNPTSSTWEACSANATNGPLPTVATGAWSRVSVYQDYSAHTVSIFLNGVAVRTNWPFINTGLSWYSNLVCEGSADGAAFLDNMSAATTTPAGLPASDINGNKMTDSLELTLYGSLNVWTGSTVTATVTNPAGGSVTPSGAVTGILYGDATNFTASANEGYVLDKAWTNGVLATNFNQQGKTGSFNWTGITTDGTFQVGFHYNGLRYVPGDHATLTGALAVAQAGDTIVVSNGTYSGSITLSNGVTLVATNLSGAASGTNLTVNGALMVVQTGTVYSAGVPCQFTVTGQVSVAAGAVLTISNTAASFGGLTIGVGGVVHVVNGALTVGGVTKTGTFDVNLVTNTASVPGGHGTISPTGPFTLLSWYSNVTYSLVASEAYTVGPLTNNGADISGQLVALDAHHWSYTDANIPSDQTILASFVYNGLRYVPGDHSTLTGALAVAQAGDTIVLGNGAYAETVTVSSSLTWAGTNITGLTSFTVQNGVTLTLQGFTNFTAASLTVVSNGVLVISNSVIDLSGLTIQSNAYIHGYNSTAIVNGVEYDGTFTLDQYWNLVLTAQPIPVNQGFETVPAGTRVDRLGYMGWNASTSGATVVSNPDTVTDTSSQAALLPPGSTVSNLVTGAGLVGGVGPTNVWLDFMARQTAYWDSPDQVNTNGPMVCFINTNGWLTVLTAGGWDVCSNDYWSAAAPNLSTGAWMQISCYLDFSSAPGKASYFVNGHLVRYALPFAHSASRITSLKVVAEDATAWLDNVNIQSNLPPGVTNNWLSACDQDHDGLAEAVELQLYGSTSYWPFGSVYKIR